MTSLISSRGSRAGTQSELLAVLVPGTHTPAAWLFQEGQFQVLTHGQLLLTFFSATPADSS